MPRKVVGTSERVLRSLVPKKDWIHEDIFVVRTAVNTTWLIDLQHETNVYSVHRQPVIGEKGLCYCNSCVNAREYWTDRMNRLEGLSAKRKSLEAKNSMLRFGPYIGHIRPRGIHLWRGGALMNRDAQAARAITIVLYLQADPHKVDDMACG